MCCTSPELRSASSYGHFTAAKEFWSQCRIFGWYIDISLGESGAHEAPYVSLLIRASRPRLGESPRAQFSRPVTSSSDPLPCLIRSLLQMSRLHVPCHKHNLVLLFDLARLWRASISSIYIYVSFLFWTLGP